MEIQKLIADVHALKADAGSSSSTTASSGPNRGIWRLVRLLRKKGNEQVGLGSISIEMTSWDGWARAAGCWENPGRRQDCLTNSVSVVADGLLQGGLKIKKDQY